MSERDIGLISVQVLDVMAPDTVATIEALLQTGLTTEEVVAKCREKTKSTFILSLVSLATQYLERGMKDAERDSKSLTSSV